MDWLRRNWPDLIIGVALVAVVALIVVTLLSGGSLASLVRRGNPPELAITDTTSSPNTPSQTPASNNSGTTNTGTDNSNAGATSTGGTDTAGTGSDTTDGGVDVFVPGVPGGRPNAVSGTPVGQAQPGAPANAAGTQTGATQSGVTQNSTNQTQGGTSAGGGPLPEAVQDGGFRVAAGAVDSRDAAVGLAESYREAGYTVTVEQQNDLYLLWIGPYATRDGAERVASRLIADDVVSDALVYTYSGPDAASGNSAPDTGSSATAPDNNAPNNVLSGNETASVGRASDAGSSAGSAGTSSTATADNGANTGASANTNANAGNNGALASATPATTPEANPATTTAQRYLQVGAFASAKSAQPLRGQLGALGFNVTQSVSDSGLVRLFVGPFGAAQLTQAQQRLAAQGVTDSFPVIP